MNLLLIGRHQKLDFFIDRSQEIVLSGSTETKSLASSTQILQHFVGST